MPNWREAQGRSSAMISFWVSCFLRRASTYSVRMTPKGDTRKESLTRADLSRRHEECLSRKHQGRLSRAAGSMDLNPLGKQSCTGSRCGAHARSALLAYAVLPRTIWKQTDTAPAKEWCSARRNMTRPRAARPKASRGSPGHFLWRLLWWIAAVSAPSLGWTRSWRRTSTRHAPRVRFRAASDMGKKARAWGYSSASHHRAADLHVIHSVLKLSAVVNRLRLPVARASTARGRQL